jgi:hypothetical protein
MIEATTGMALTELGPQPAGKTARSIMLHALAAAFMCVSPLIVFVPAAWISSGLRNGRKGAYGAVAGSIILLAALAAADSTPAVFAGHLGEISGLLLALGIPSLIALVMMRRGASFGQVMLAVILSSVTGLFATELIMRSTLGVSPYETLVANFRAQSTATIDVYRKLGTPEDALVEMSRMSQTFAASYLVFMIESLIVTMFTLSLMMIPRLPSGRATGGRYLLRHLAFPDVLLFGFVAGGLSPLASGPLQTVGFNVLGVTVFLYLLQGFAVLRFTLIRVGVGLAGNLLTCIVTVLFMPISAAVLFLVGLFDPFFDFRKLNRKDDSNESHTD